MDTPELVTLPHICDLRKISREWYAALRRRALVPGFLRAKSLGRGQGRRYLYHLQDALRAIDLVRSEQDSGKSLDEITREHGRWALPRGPEFEDEKSLTSILREILDNRWDEIQLVSIAIRKAVELGSFSDFNVVLSERDVRFQIHDEQELGPIKDLLRDFVNVYKRHGAGNAVVWSTDMKAWRAMAFTVPVEPSENAHDSEWKKFKQALKEWEVERQRLEASARMWATWPPPVKSPGSRHGIAPAGKRSR